MYIPKHFEQTDISLMHALMADNPLATLIVNSTDGLSADHIPLLFKQDGSAHGKLVGHVARTNPLSQAEAASTAVLAVFHGPQTYISPSLYASKSQGGKVVPTWNYAVVHAHGSLNIVKDHNWLKGQLDELTSKNERTMPSPWNMSDAPTEFIDRLLNAIVGIEISISSLRGKWKVSQNQPENNQASAIAGLRAAGTDQAILMSSLIESHSRNPL
jgi:transcriptional regulator